MSIAYFYLSALLFSIAGLLAIDFRHKLVLFGKRRGIVPVVWGILFFLVWDIAGVALGIFGTEQRLVSGLSLGHPDLPFEELCFLFLLCYLSSLFVAKDE